MHKSGLNSPESGEEIKLTMHHILHAVDERCITGWQEEQLEAGRPAAVDFGARSLFMPIIYFEPIIHQCQLVKK